MEIREFCLKLFEEENCPLDTYRNNSTDETKVWGGYEWAIGDATDIVDRDPTIPFTAESIAKELVAIGNEQPGANPPRKGHKKYCMIWNTDDCTDGTEHDTFEAAMADAEDTLINWILDEQKNWEFDEKGIPHPTEKQIEDYDYMISENYACVVEWNEETQEYGDTENGTFPNEDEIGWLYYEELKVRFNW